MSAPRLAALAFALTTLAPAAWAADATPEQAQALERQVREWISGTFGSALNLTERPVRITPEGDHFAVAVPLGSAPDALRLTATARMSDGGRWNIDNIRFPSPAEFTLTLPQPSKDDSKAPPTMVPVTYKVTIGQQAGQILFDPAYATASTLNSTLQNLDVQASGPGLEQTSHMDRNSTTSILRPAAGGRLDLLSDSTVEGYRITSKTTDSELLKLAFGRVRVTGELDGVSRDRGTQILQALMQVSPASAGSGGSPKLDDKAVQTLLEAVADFATAFTIDESIEKLSVSYGDYGGLLNTARIGMTMKADQGLLQARMDLGAEGLTLPDLPLGDMAALIPTKVALRPVVSGIPVQELIKVAKSSQNGGTPSAGEIQALFSRGGINAGLESFAIDVAGTGFTGMGKLVFTSPQAFSGTAQITATNLDLLQQRVAASPDMQSALPVFIFAKGIGRTVENRMVWDVTYQNGRLLVNNQDLTAMTGGAAPDQDQQPPPARPQQQRQPQNRTR